MMTIPSPMITASRVFESGASRDTLEGKLAFSGFLSPVVLTRFAEYMHKHRLMSDGSMRGPDNWKRGIPKDVYLDSLLRHVMAVWTGMSGERDMSDEELEDTLCGAMFNIQGLLFEHMREES